MVKKQKSTTLEQVYSYLRENGKVRTQREFCNVLQYPETPMSRILKGTNPIPLRLLKSLYQKYRVNINFIISGDGEMLLKDETDDPTSGLKLKIDGLEREIEILRKSLTDKDKIISMLESNKKK